MLAAAPSTAPHGAGSARGVCLMLLCPWVAGAEKAESPTAGLHGGKPAQDSYSLQKCLPLDFIILSPKKETVTCLHNASAVPSVPPLACRAIQAALPVKNLSCSQASEQQLPASLVCCLEEKLLSFQESNLYLGNMLSRVPLVRKA